MIDPAIADYIRRVGVREPPAMRANRETTEAAGNGHLQIDPEQGAVLAMMVRLMGARRALEVGVYAGYSALWVGHALPADGHLLAIDFDPEITARARADWQAAGLAERIELRVADARAALDGALAERAAGTYDLALIDADKQGYIDYYERCLSLVRRGGLIAADNTLWYARVVDETDTSADTRAIRAFNDHVSGDARVVPIILPLGDGLSLLHVQ